MALVVDWYTLVAFAFAFAFVLWDMSAEWVGLGGDSGGDSGRKKVEEWTEGNGTSRPYLFLTARKVTREGASGAVGDLFSFIIVKVDCYFEVFDRTRVTFPSW